MSVLRTWACLNRRCGDTFDAWEAAPSCPTCGCARVSWVPRGGHIATVAGNADAELRQLADCFSLTDLRSAARGEAAKKIKAQPVVDQKGAPPMHFAPGFSAVAHPAQAVCVPSASNVTFKAKVGMGQALAKSRTVPGVHANTAIEATHRPRP